MTTVRTVAAHEVVEAVHPRPPPTERDELGRVAGSAIDGALSRFSHEARTGRRPSIAGILDGAREALDEGLREIDLSVPSEERDRVLRQVEGVVRAFRSSPLYGLGRPRSRLVLIGEEVGVYAQPDYWDGRASFYEMKSYRATSDRPEIALQLRLFQLAFPGFRAVLASFDRHVEPVRATLTSVAPLSPEAERSTLAEALRVGRSKGVPKVLEYIDLPTVRYPLPPG